MSSATHSPPAHLATNLGLTPYTYLQLGYLTYNVKHQAGSARDEES